MLNCGLSGDVIAVIPEHFEDLLVRCEDHWRFIQIKTRDSSQGSWTLRRLAGSDKAPLRSLLQTFELTKDIPESTYEAYLEQGLSRDAVSLRTAQGRKDPKILKSLREYLNISIEECASFLFRVRVKADLAPRSNIDMENIRILLSHKPDMTWEVAESIYLEALNAIQAAMSIRSTDVDWSAVIDDPDYLTESALRNKCLDRNACSALFTQISSSPNRLLSRSLDSQAARPTALESKLLAGGASTQVVEHAVLLRAHADRLEYLWASSRRIEPRDTGGRGDEQLEDVRTRLLMKHESLRATMSDQTAPANQIWSELLTAFNSHPDQFDASGIFNQDGFLLLGELCQLSDECKALWS